MRRKNTARLMVRAESPACLCAKGATHPSLGRSPRNRTEKCGGLKARSIHPTPMMMGRAFSPLSATGANLGRCPRLE